MPLSHHHAYHFNSSLCCEYAKSFSIVRAGRVCWSSGSEPILHVAFVATSQFINGWLQGEDGWQAEMLTAKVVEISEQAGFQSLPTIFSFFSKHWPLKCRSLAHHIPQSQSTPDNNNYDDDILASPNLSR